MYCQNEFCPYLKNNHQKKMNFKNSDRNTRCKWDFRDQIYHPALEGQNRTYNQISNPKFWLHIRSVLVGSNSVHVGNALIFFTRDFSFSKYGGQMFCVHISSRSRSSICQIHTRFHITVERDLRDITILLRFTHGKF